MDMTNEELVRAVAQEVMGFVLGEEIGLTHAKGMLWHYRDGRIAPNPFAPLTNANHRDMVVEKMREKGWRCVIECWPTHWYARFDRDEPRQYSEMAGSLGHAVCHAALKAVRGEK